MDAKVIGIYAMAVFLMVTVFMTSYIGFTLFFYCSLLCLFTPLTTGISYITDRASNPPEEIAHLIMWCFYAIPLVSFILSINWQLFARFFKNYTGIFDIDQMYEYVEHHFNKPRGLPKLLTTIGLGLMSLVCVGIVIVFCTSKKDGWEWAGFAIAIVSLIGPISAFIKVPLTAWRSVIRLIRKRRQVFREATSPLNKPVKLENVGIDVDPDASLMIEKPKNRISIMDPFHIRKQEEWVGYLESDTNSFVAILHGQSWLKFIPYIIFTALALVYIGLDIAVSVHRINVARNTTFDADVQEFEKQLIEVRQELRDQGRNPGEIGDIVDEMKIFATGLLPTSLYLILITIFRICVGIYLLPFVVSGNVVSVFMNWGKMGKQTIIRICHIIASALVVIYFIIFTIWRIVMGDGSKLNPYKDLSGTYQFVEPTYKTVTNVSHIPICDLKINNWDYMEAISLPMLSQLKKYDRDIYTTISNELYKSTKTYIYDFMEMGIEFESGKSFSTEDINIPTLGYGKYTMGEDGVTKSFMGLMYGFGGVSDAGHLAFIIENVLRYWFDFAMTALIPFFSIVRGFAMDLFLDNVPGFIDDVFFGFQTAVQEQMREELFWLATVYDGEFYIFDSLNVERTPYGVGVVGHSSGGIFAKAFAAKKKLSVLALETPQFAHSSSYDLIHGLDLTNDIDIGWERMVNVYSTGNLYAADEANATANWKYPSSNKALLSALTLTKEHETFCYHAAACVTDDRYDNLCSWLVGADTYNEYFKMWKRPRSPIAVKPK